MSTAPRISSAERSPSTRAPSRCSCRDYTGAGVRTVYFGILSRWPLGVLVPSLTAPVKYKLVASTARDQGYDSPDATVCKPSPFIQAPTIFPSALLPSDPRSVQYTQPELASTVNPPNVGWFVAT